MRERGLDHVVLGTIHACIHYLYTSTYVHVTSCTMYMYDDAHNTCIKVVLGLRSEGRNIVHMLKNIADELLLYSKLHCTLLNTLLPALTCGQDAFPFSM